MYKADVKSKSFNGEIFFNGSPDDTRTIFSEIFIADQYEKGLSYIKTLKKPVVVDCGAHVGMASLYFNHAKNATIYALEPNPDNYEALLENVKPYPNIKTFEIGLRSFEGESGMSGQSGGASLTSLYAVGENKVMVKHTTIEKFLNEHNINHVDMLKIDVEGAEYEIFLSKAFKAVEDRIDFILGEAHTNPVYPQAIPAILENYNVEWLPIKNIISNIKGRLTGEDEDFDLRVEMETLFVARRKK